MSKIYKYSIIAVVSLFLSGSDVGKEVRIMIGPVSVSPYKIIKPIKKEIKKTYKKVSKTINKIKKRKWNNK
ncbi:MAG: hypothetical protein H8D80_01400 [Proteobacteria bacterium]|nr:hypothetical protein [Pseudomonadota bacterium]